MYRPLKNGRYYKFFVESTGSAYKLTLTDIEGATISGTALNLPVGYKILDVLYDVNSVEGSASTLSCSLKFNSDGSQGIVLPGKANFTDADIYIYAVKGE